MSNVEHVEALSSVHPLATHDERHTWINRKMKEKWDKDNVTCYIIPKYNERKLYWIFCLEVWESNSELFLIGQRNLMDKPMLFVLS